MPDRSVLKPLSGTRSRTCTCPSTIFTSGTDTSIGAPDWFAAGPGAASRFGIAASQFTAAVAVAPHEHLGRLQRDGAELVLAAEHVDRGHRHVDVLQVQQWLAVQLGQAELVQVHAAFDREHRRAALGAHERHRQLAVQQPGGHAEREVERHIFHVARNVELLDVDVHRRLEGVLERLGAALQREGRVVHARRERWLHVVLDSVGQVGQEGNGDVDLAHAVARMLGAVVDLDAAVDDLHVVQREARLLAGFLAGRGPGFPVERGLGPGELLDQIGEVVGACIRVAHDMHVGVGELHLAQDRRAPVDRFGLQVELELGEAHEHLRGIALLDAEPLDRRDHTERVQIDILDRHLPVEQCGQLLGQVVPCERRHGEEADDREQDEEDRDAEDGPPEQEGAARWRPQRRRAGRLVPGEGVFDLV